MTTHAQRAVEVQVDALVPRCMYWSYDQVADWIEGLGYPIYKDSFRENFINGRKLLLIEATHLPRIGITDFKHIRIISEAIRELLEQPEKPNYFKSISLPRRDPMGTYLELKTRSGRYADQLTYSKFVKTHDKYLQRIYGEKAPKIPKA